MVDGPLIKVGLSNSRRDTPVIYHIKYRLVFQLCFKLSEFSCEVISSRVGVLNVCYVHFLNSHIDLPLIRLSLHLPLLFSGIFLE